MKEFIVAGREGVGELVECAEALDPREPHLVTMIPLRPTRNADQNKLMWVLLRMLAQGGDAWVMKDEMSCRYFGYTDVPYVDDRGYWVVRKVPLVQHTSSLDTETMGGFLDFLYAQVIEWCVS